MARRTSTATTAVPMAATTAPTPAPIALDVEQFPVHCTSTNANPMRPPAKPPTRIATNASARAVLDGNAESAAPEEDGLCVGPGVFT